MNAGKGDSPRNCFSKIFKKNYEKIDWKSKKRHDSIVNADNDLSDLDKKSLKNSIEEIQ